ncbi:MAG TPA: ATP-binding protein [Acidimicrobiia bacterium]
MASTKEILRSITYFSDLPEELLKEVCDASEQIRVQPGELIIREGEESRELYVLAEGELVVTTKQNGVPIELARIKAGDVAGELALLDNAPRIADVAAAIPSLVVRVPGEAFNRLLDDPRVVRRMFRTVTSRLRSTEEILRHGERMAALGRMAAQLMHELNNPASAVGRTSKELARVHEELVEVNSALALQLGYDPLRHEPVKPPDTPIARATAEEAMADWLTEEGVEGAWELAPTLVEAGWTPEILAETVSHTSGSVRTNLLRFIALRDLSGQLIDEIGMAAARVSELVRIVKEYSFLDQAPVQEVQVAKGIKDTLILLKHKLRHLEVVFDHDDDLAPVQAPGRDLNQVWTNLIDNASDAMPEGGRLVITARNADDHVVVTVSDTGPGIPESALPRIFDPFFTTKGPGEGTGLGLHTSHNIVTRAGGMITVDTGPNGTTFTVSLPVSQ